MKNPCVRECPDRTATCHAACGAYAAYAKWCEKKRLERWRRGEAEAFFRVNAGRIKRMAGNEHRD